MSEFIPSIFAGDKTYGPGDVSIYSNGMFFVQRPYLTSIRGPDDLITRPRITKKKTDYVMAREPTEQETQDLLDAWYICMGVRSNGIVFYRDGMALAVGAGEQERVGAVEKAIEKALKKGHNLEGAVLASDGFFPFRDSIDEVSNYGITAVVQPGGSRKDYEVIKACNEYNMAMVFTGERCFAHF